MSGTCSVARGSNVGGRQPRADMSAWNSRIKRSVTSEQGRPTWSVRRRRPRVGAVSGGRGGAAQEGGGGRRGGEERASLARLMILSSMSVKLRQ